MKVLMTCAPIHPVPPRHSAAVEWWMYQVGLRSRHELLIACTHQPGYAIDERVSERLRIHRVQIGRAYKRLFQKWTKLDPHGYADRVLAQARRHDAELVYVHNSISTYAEIKRRARDLPLVLHMHNEQPAGELTAADRLVVPSRYLRDWYARNSKAQDIRVIGNGVDLDACAQPGPALDVPASAKRTVLFAGRFSEEKGALALAEAFLASPELAARCRLLLVGESDPAKLNGQRAAYVRRVRDAVGRLGDGVFAGSLPPEAMLAAYRAADLVVVPSLFEEPFCMVAIEAMAAGVPVLASRRGGMPEYLIDGETGFLIGDPLDATGLAGDILRALDAPQRNAVIAASTAMVRARFGWARIAADFDDYCAAGHG
ncbi:glycosyltransferase [Jeongeupia wiesaeckerbachi]|uniref:glycosyltransferase n=1 Tax=Jeongeupia wiesaeckerbachi TaxID=3051218 RepID=UPI003D8045CA